MLEHSLSERDDVIGTRSLGHIVNQRVQEMLKGISTDIRANLVVDMLQTSRIDGALAEMEIGLISALETTVEYAATTEEEALSA